MERRIDTIVSEADYEEAFTFFEQELLKSIIVGNHWRIWKYRFILAKLDRKYKAQYN